MWVGRMTIVLASMLMACEPGDSAAPGEGRARRVVFEPAVMNGWACRVTHDMAIEVAGTEVHATTNVDLEVVASPGSSKLALIVGEIKETRGTAGRQRITTLDATRITITEGGELRSQTASEHPDVQRVIEDVTGASRISVELDTRATWVRQSGRFDPVVNAMFPGLAGLGVDWAFGLPELPGAWETGQRWQGLRSFLSDGRHREQRLDYVVERVVDGVAHVSIRAEAEGDLPAGLRGRRVLEGTSRIRVRDAAYLGSHTQERIDLEGAKVETRVGRRIDVECDPSGTTPG